MSNDLGLRDDIESAFIESHHAYALLEAIRAARCDLGVSRLKLGSLLSIARNDDLWREFSSASTFRQFLEEESIEHRAAYQYIDAAEGFFSFRALSDSEMAALALVSMRVLTEAAKRINSDNYEEILHLVTTLKRQDASQELDQFNLKRPPSAKPPQRVQKLLDQLSELGFEERSAFFSLIKGSNK